MLCVLFGSFLVPTWRDGPPRVNYPKPAGVLAALSRLAREEDGLRWSPSGFGGGKVVEVADDTVTVRTQSGFRRTFEVSPEVASKNIPLASQKPFCAHRLNQVQVGDAVCFHVVPTSRGPVVIALGIQRRPGGVIPMAEDEHLHELMRAHNVFNKHQMEDIAEEHVMPKMARLLARFHR